MMSIANPKKEHPDTSEGDRKGHQLTMTFSLSLFSLPPRPRTFFCGLSYSGAFVHYKDRGTRETRGAKADCFNYYDFVGLISSAVESVQLLQLVLYSIC